MAGDVEQRALDTATTHTRGEEGSPTLVKKDLILWMGFMSLVYNRKSYFVGFPSVSYPRC